MTKKELLKKLEKYPDDTPVRVRTPEGENKEFIVDDEYKTILIEQKYPGSPEMEEYLAKQADRDKARKEWEGLFADNEE